MSHSFIATKCERRASNMRALGRRWRWLRALHSQLLSCPLFQPYLACLLVNLFPIPDLCRPRMQVQTSATSVTLNSGQPRTGAMATASTEREGGSMHSASTCNARRPAIRDLERKGLSNVPTCSNCPGSSSLKTRPPFLSTRNSTGPSGVSCAEYTKQVQKTER